MAKVLTDQYHIDIYQTKPTTKKEQQQIEAVMESPWFPDMITSLFDPKLRKKLKIEITR